VPSQAKVLTGAEICAKGKSTSPRLFSILAFDRIAGLCNRLPNSKGEYANAHFSEVRLKALTDKSQTIASGLILGEINFGWLVVRVLSPDWLSCKPGSVRLYHAFM
jgi:hypothetical protein